MLFPLASQSHRPVRPLLSEQGSAALVSAQDSTASSATTARRRKEKTYRQVGTESVELVSSSMQRAEEKLCSSATDYWRSECHEGGLEGSDWHGRE